MSFISSNSAGYSKQVPLLTGQDEDSEEELFERSRAPPPEKGAMGRVKSELEGAMNVMRNNLTKVIDRGERLEDLEAKSEAFEMNAFEFKSRSKKLKNRMWWQQMRMKLVFGCIVIGVVTVVIVSLVIKYKK